MNSKSKQKLLSVKSTLQIPWCPRNFNLAQAAHSTWSKFPN